MKTKNYIPESKNARAVCQLKAWLESCGIKVDGAGRGDLLVFKQDGTAVPVVVSVDSGVSGFTDPTFVMYTTEILNKDLNVCFQAFHKLTEFLGFGSPTPVDRGSRPEKSLRYRDDFELVSMRHCDFRRSPNPSPAKLQQYKPIVERSCRTFLRNNPGICSKNLLEFEDLKSFASVWMVNYIALFEIANPTNNDNERLLSNYLYQRFSEFKKRILKKNRNMFPNKETAVMSLYSNYGSWNEDKHFFAFHDTRVEEDTTVKKPKFRRTSRITSARVLAKHMDKLGHQELISKLQSVMGDPDLYQDDVRKEAARQLKKHLKNCSTCNPSESLEMNDEPVAVNALCSSK